MTLLPSSSRKCLKYKNEVPLRDALPRARRRGEELPGDPQLPHGRHGRRGEADRDVSTGAGGYELRGRYVWKKL